MPIRLRQDTPPGGSATENDTNITTPTSVPPSSTSDPTPTTTPNPPSSSDPSTPPDSSSVPPSSEPPQSSSSVPPSSSQPPSSSSSATPSQSSSSSESTISSTPPPPSPSSTPTPTPSSTSASSDAFPSSFTTIVTTLGDGSVSTSISALPTSLSTATSRPNPQNRVGIIAGMTTMGVVILLIILGVVFAYRRNRLRKLWHEIALRSSKGRKERKGLLEDEDFDDDVPFGRGGGGVGMRMYRDLGSEGHSRVPSGVSSGFDTGPGVYRPGSSTAYNPPNNPFPSSSQPSTPTTHSGPSPSAYTHSSHSPAPSLFRARASESGSIFREEGVWPPPGEGSEFVDPFVGHVRQLSDEVGGELGRVVRDVMGPGNSNPGIKSDASSSTTSLVPVTMAMARATPPPGSTSTSTPTPNANVGNTALAPRGLPTAASLTQIRSSTSMPPTAGNTATHGRDEYIGTPRITAMPVPMTPSPPATPTHVTTRSVSSGGEQGSTTPTPTQAAFAPTSSASVSLNPNTKLPSTRSNTVKSTGTETSASMYSTSGSSAKTSEFGLRSLGSTPPPPVVPTLPTQYQRELGYRGNATGGTSLGLPPGAAPSIPPGSSSRVYEKLSMNSSVYSQGSVARSTASLGSGTSTVSGSVYSQASAPYEMDYPGSAGPTSSRGTGVNAGGPPLVDLTSAKGEGREDAGLSGLSSASSGSGSSGLKVPASQPKKSSPLARALSSDAKILLRE